MGSCHNRDRLAAVLLFLAEAAGISLLKDSGVYKGLPATLISEAELESRNIALLEASVGQAADAQFLPSLQWLVCDNVQVLNSDTKARLLPAMSNLTQKGVNKPSAAQQAA